MTGPDSMPNGLGEQCVILNGNELTGEKMHTQHISQFPSGFEKHSIMPYAMVPCHANHPNANDQHSQTPCNQGPCRTAFRQMY